MAALSKARYVTERLGQQAALGMAAAAMIYLGGITCRNALGKAVKGSTALNLVALGIAEDTVDNTAGADDAVAVPYRSGVFKLENSAAGDLITAADIGNDCFIVDDQTVAKTNGGATRSRAGKIVDVDTDGGVFVRIGAGV